MTPPMMLPPFFSRSYTCGREDPAAVRNQWMLGLALPILVAADHTHIRWWEPQGEVAFVVGRLCKALARQLVGEAC